MTACNHVTSRASYSGSKYVLYVRLMPKLMPSILTGSTYYSIIIFLMPIILRYVWIPKVDDF